ncbi:MAG: vWA domain-containing protein [Bdellovibrio sp.]
MRRPTISRTHFLLFSTIAVVLVAFQNCAPVVSFVDVASEDPLSAYEVGSSGRFETTFKFVNTEKISLTQDNLGLNESSLTFRVDSAKEIDLNRDVKIYENNRPVTKYYVDANSLDKSKIGNVDIALVVDTTGSMGATIESIKIRLKSFVENVYAKGSNARICISTFGDTTVSKCSKFYSINSADPASEAEKTTLLSQLSSLKVSGGGDAPENPMRALLDSLSADWVPTNQQFIILVTDAPFHYAPSYKGHAGDAAPVYADVLTAFAARKINIFAATPSLAGYNSNFDASSAGIVSATGGEWFLYSDIVSGKVTFDTILDRIVKRVNSMYTLRYISEENSLDPKLPVASRNVRVEINGDSTSAVSGLQLVSNMPSGRADYKKEFSLTSKEFDKTKVMVKVNGINYSTGFKITADNKLLFNAPPVPSAKIDVTLTLTNLKQSVEFSSIVFASNLKEDSVYLTLNGQAVDKKYYKLEKSLEGRYSMLLDESLFEETDPFKIRSYGGLSIDIRYLYADQKAPAAGTVPK